MEKKICKTCSIEKDLDSFWKNKRRIDGKEYNCIECMKLKNNTPEKKELQAKLNKEWREKNPDYMAAYGKSEKSKEYHRQYYKENSEIYIKRKQEWRKANPIQAIIERKNYEQQNKDNKIFY